MTSSLKDTGIAIGTGLVAGILTYVIIGVVFPAFSTSQSAIISAIPALITSVLSRTIAGILKEYLLEKTSFGNGSTDTHSGDQRVDADGNLSATASQNQDLDGQSQETDIDIDSGSFEATQAHGEKE